MRVNVEYVLLNTTKSNTREKTSFSVLDYIVSQEILKV